MSEEQEFITKEKQADLETELQELKSTVRTEILARLQFAKSLGDLSENAEYHAARDDQGKNEARIKRIEYILKNAVIVEKNNSGIVGLGSTITVQKSGEDSTRTFTLVGAEEADMSAGKLSFQSPLGEALLDKAVGDTATISTSKGESVYTITEIS